jgi:gliding motility-associated lipoprotein GldH
MRSVWGFIFIVAFFVSCDQERLYEKNIDFDGRYWPVSEKPVFEFEIKDTVQAYNLYGNVRNSLSYPYARIFITYYLQDTAGVVLEKELASHLLFDEKTGKPHGESGLGDLYDHRIPLKLNYRFPRQGKYHVLFEQYMRTDTLGGILAVGLRVEKVSSTTNKEE